MTREELLKIVITAQDNASKTIKGVSNAMQEAGKKIQETGKKMTEIGQSLTKKITAPILGVGAAALKVTSDMEQNKIAFDVLLKSGEKASVMLKDLSDFAAKTPFDLPGVVTASKQLLAYGYTQEQIIPTMKMLGDVAAGVGAPVGDLAYLFGTLKAQGKAMTVDIRQFANRGIPIWENLAAVVGETVERTQEMVTEGKIGYPIVEEAFRRMTAEGGQFYNLMEAQSKSFGGVMSNLKDNLVRVGMAMMGLSTDAETYGQIIKGGLFDVIKTGAETALEKLNKLTEAFTNLSPEMKKMVVIGGGLAAAFGPALMIFGKILGSLQLLLSPIGLVSAAILGLGIAFGVKFVEDSGGFTGAMDNIKTKLGEVKDRFEETKNKITEFIRTNDSIQAVITILTGVFSSFKKTMGDLSEEWEQLKIAIQPILPELKLIGEAIGITLFGIIISFIGLLSVVITAIANAAKGVVKVVESVLQIFSGIIGMVKSIITGDWAMAWQYFLDIPKGIIGIFQGLFQTLFGFIGGAIEGIVRFFRNLKETLIGHSIIPEIVNGIVDWFKSLPGRIWDAIKSIPGKLAQAFRFPEIKMPSWLGKIPGFQHGTPYVPQTGLAILHRGEAVIPANRNRMVGGSSIVVNINGGNYLGDARDVGKVVADYIMDELGMNMRVIRH